MLILIGQSINDDVSGSRKLNIEASERLVRINVLKVVYQVAEQSDSRKHVLSHIAKN